MKVYIVIYKDMYGKNLYEKYQREIIMAESKTGAEYLFRLDYPNYQFMEVVETDETYSED